MAINQKTFEPVRPPIRDAAQRTAELRGHFGSAGLDEGTDEFYIDPAIIPDGWSYEWKRMELLGKEDPAYQVSLARTGWEPVPASRHTVMMPREYAGDTIIRKGMMLMERPLEITEEAKEIERRRARQQVRVKEEQLNAAPPGQFDRQNKDAPLARVKKSFEAIPIPEK